MGNLHAERSIIGVINPPDNPYLHVVPKQFTDGQPTSYRYVDSLHGMVLMVGWADLSRGVSNFSPRVRIELPFLPDEINVRQITPPLREEKLLIKLY
jgi:hypothetical protein